MWSIRIFFYFTVGEHLSQDIRKYVSLYFCFIEFFSRKCKKGFQGWLFLLFGLGVGKSTRQPLYSLLNVHEKNMSHERALHFDQWEKIFKKSKSIRIWWWVLYKIAKSDCRWVHSNSKEASYLPIQTKYSNLKTICIIKPMFFLWAYFLENLLSAKNLIIVPAASIPFLINNCRQTPTLYFVFIQK